MCVGDSALLFRFPSLGVPTVGDVSTLTLPSRPAPTVRETERIGRRVRDSLWWPVAVVVLLHSLTFTGTLSSDEGGFAMIARWLSVPGQYLYNTMWVDRPPVLIGVFKVATLLGPHGTRIVATALAVVLVLALGGTAKLVAGTRASVWTAWIACGLASSTMYATQELNGEIIAAVLVSLAMLGIVHAVKGGRGWRWSALAAGLAAAAALLVKQNFADGFVFIGVYALLSLRGRVELRGRFLALVGWTVGGALVPIAASLAWASSHGGIGALAYAMYGFRLDASRLIGETGGSAVSGRLSAMVSASISSFLLPLVLCVLLAALSRLRRFEPLAMALLAAFVTEIVGVVGGGNYWLHYLIGIIPTVALAAGLVAARTGVRSLLVKLVAGAAVISSVAGIPFGAAADARGSQQVAAVGTWLHDSRVPGDTLTTLYTHASINYLADMRPAYPYSWSLPLRVRDPQLALLTSTLSGPNAPTWVLGWDRMDTWGLDARGNLSRALKVHYRQVATVCGKTVWLHDGVTRNLATTPRMGEC